MRLVPKLSFLRLFNAFIFSALTSNSVFENLSPQMVTRSQLIRVYFPHFKGRPNVHIGNHFRGEAELSGTNRNTEVSSKEKKHLEPKSTARHSNKADLCRDFMEQANISMVFRHLLDGGQKMGIRAGDGLLRLKTDEKLKTLMNGLHSGAPCIPSVELCRPISFNLNKVPNFFGNVEPFLP